MLTLLKAKEAGLLEISLTVALTGSDAVILSAMTIPPNSSAVQFRPKSIWSIGV